MSEPKQIGTIIAETFVGRRVRFPDLAQQFDRDEVHTVEKLLFGGYDSDEGDEDPGVEIHFITSHAPGLCGATKAIIICALSDRVEFVDGEQSEAPEPDERLSPRPGTRMLDLPPSSSDPLRQAAESLKRFVRRRRGEALYALTLHPDGSGILTVCDGDEVASVELSDPMVEQLIERLRSRGRVLPNDESI